MMRGGALPLVRRLHYGLGLMFLFFIWLFALSGLLLNHEWVFADFWPRRQETVITRMVDVPATGDDLATARSLMAELGLRGEIGSVGRDAHSRTFHVDLARPGLSIAIDLAAPSAKADRVPATIKTIRFDGWGILRTLHTFSGASYEQPDRRRDWALATLWAAMMLASAAALLLMVLTSLYLWWRLRAKRISGGLALGGGCVLTALFVFGLRAVG